MARLFSLASWNVEHFKGDPTRVRRVVDYLKGLEPDVFALLEVEGKAVFPSLVKRMPVCTRRSAPAGPGWGPEGWAAPGKEQP